MSSSLSQSIIPGITETSSVSERIDVLRSCYKKEVFDEVKRLLISQTTSDREKIELLQQEKIELLQQEYLSLSKELKECGELVSQLREIVEMVSRKHVQVYRQLQSVSSELAKMKAKQENVQDNIVQNILSQLIVLEEDSATGQKITPSFDLNMPPQDDSRGEQDS